MKKIFPYILIVLIAVQLFAPFSIGSGKDNDLEMRSNKAEAVWPVPDDNGIALQSTVSNTDTSITATVNVSWSVKAPLTKEEVRVTITDIAKGTSESQPVVLTKTDQTGPLRAPIYTGSAIFNKNTTSSTAYNINTEARQINTLLWTKNNSGGDIWDVKYSVPSDGEIFITKTDDTITTNPQGVTTVITGTTQNAQNNNAILAPYSCNILSAFTWTGCAGRIIYTVIFQPASFLFALSGKLLDWTFFYSVSDSSYRSNFVVQGWTILRDVCNMFFIFILLYIAVGTILKLNAVKTREMIINVVLIGLFINFSLFVTQVIIDSSNILARVFYNTNIIVAGPTKDSTGAIISTPNKDGSIRMSEAIVNKINPQELIVNSQKTSEDGQPLSPEAFLTITILASAVSIVGFLTFLTVGLIFIARVIGLWLAMILAPIAFFTYTIPQLQDSKNIGWKNWWPETVKLAFMAPIFMFFMYILIKFLSIGLGVFNADKEVGMAFIIAIMVPFIFIMIFLTKAKSIATSMSGEFGAMVTKAGSSIGGMALGAATGGYAMIGRATLGRYAGSVADSEKLKEKAKEGGLGGYAARMKLKAANYGKKASFDARATQAGALAGKSLGVDLGKAKVGGYAAYQDTKVKNEVATNEMLRMSDSAAFEQDEKAKAYNKKYQEEMLAKKKADEASGKMFNEVDFRTNAINGFEKVNGIKPKTSDQINRQRMTDRAESTKNEFFMDDKVKAGVLKDLKAKSTPEKPPVSELDKYNAGKSLTQATKIFDNAVTELKDIDSNLSVIAAKNGIPVESINRSHIMKEVDAAQAKVTLHESTIIQKTAALTKNPKDIKAQKDLAAALLAKKSEEGNINRLNSLLSNKERYESTKAQQTNTINQQNNILAQRQP